MGLGRLDRGRVRVCILDSGIDPNHPLVGPVTAAYEVVSDGGETRVRESSSGDACGHGTACAGIVREIAPDCELYGLRVLGEGFTGTGKILLAGLRRAVDQVFDVINRACRPGGRSSCPCCTSWPTTTAW